MKAIYTLLSAILITLIYLAAHMPPPVVIPDAPAPHVTTRWKYQVESYQDDRDYLVYSAKTQSVYDDHGVGSWIYLGHQESLSYTNWDGVPWEMCGCFMDQTKYPGLVIIYKQAAN